MVWEERRLRDIREADVRQLVDSGLEEHLQLEYKSALYAGNRDGNKESLLDVCQFANAEGGILLIGVDERRDAQERPTGSPDPNATLGIDDPNPERILQSYDSRVVSCIEERLPIESASIPVANGRHVLAIRIPNSLNKPHCVRHEGHVYFPFRRERHRYYMDVREIKEMVMRTASRIERAEQELRNTLLEMPQQDDLPYIIIGVIPVFWRDFSVNVRDDAVIRSVGMFGLAETPNFRQPEYSFNGLERSISHDISRLQLRRNGLIVLNLRMDRGGEPNGPRSFYPVAIDTVLRYFVLRSRDVYNAARIDGPYLLTMVIRCRSRLKGLYPDMFPGDFAVVIRENDYPFPIMQTESLIETDKIIRPLCDQTHQMFGQPRSPSFDHQSAWITHN